MFQYVPIVYHACENPQESPYYAPESLDLTEHQGAGLKKQVGGLQNLEGWGDFIPLPFSLAVSSCLDRIHDSDICKPG